MSTSVRARPSVGRRRWKCPAHEVLTPWGKHHMLRCTPRNPKSARMCMSNGGQTRGAGSPRWWIPRPSCCWWTQTRRCARRTVVGPRGRTSATAPSFRLWTSRTLSTCIPSPLVPTRASKVMAAVSTRWPTMLLPLWWWHLTTSGPTPYSWTTTSPCWWLPPT